ncbi:SDR family oxidoreductase [Microbacterium sp. CPCC 204701]|uniref:SDR family oxidoreductase n=1 Tax=Microbacterium sp. CPCC 204701 TaxID=2493084 RepID=UPI000FDA58AC|nr:SDR family oxidoreductase [Microbacterium sp. CPCC 204701]
MTRILIFGGHGRVALLLEPLLVREGHTVTAVIRDPAHEAEVSAAGAQPVVADVELLEVEQLTNLIAGNDVVVWSAGAGGGNPARTYAVDRDAAIRSMDAAAAAGVDRYLMVSWLGSRADHGVASGSSFFPYADAKWAADEHLAASALDWTILAPGTLTLDAPTGRIQLDPAGGGEVPRADVAAAIAAAIDDDSTIGRTIRFGGGGEVIGHAIAG